MLGPGEVRGGSLKALALPHILVPGRQLPLARKAHSVPGATGDSRRSRPTCTSLPVPTHGCSTVEGWD